MTTTEDKIIAKPWHGNGNGSLIVTIPRIIAQKCNLTASSYVTIQGADDGIVTIKKINIGDLK